MAKGPGGGRGNTNSSTTLQLGTGEIYGDTTQPHISINQMGSCSGSATREYVRSLSKATDRQKAQLAVAERGRGWESPSEDTTGTPKTGERKITRILEK